PPSSTSATTDGAWNLRGAPTACVPAPVERQCEAQQHRTGGTQMSMLTRQAKLVLGLVLAGAVLLGTAFAQDPVPVQGGSITVAIVAEPPGWDPSASTSQEIP